MVTCMWGQIQMPPHISAPWENGIREDYMGLIKITFDVKMSWENGQKCTQKNEEELQRVAYRRVCL